ncbi:hypothetical protein ACP4OV_005200 [Aristida adscensionis]
MLAVSTSVPPPPPPPRRCGSEMRKPRDRFKESDAYSYCNERIDEREKRFFKVMVGDFHERLVIPDKFEQHFRGKFGTTIQLESRSGYTFDAQVAKRHGRLVLQSGWKSFVSAHDLKMGDFLVFKYDSISHLKVLMFDISGCEKIPPNLVAKNAIMGEKRLKNTEILSRNCDPPMKSLPSDKKPLKQKVSSRQRDRRVHSEPSYILPIRTQLTTVQMKKLKRKVQAIRSAVPIYACVMRKSSISGRTRSVNISGEYAALYLPFEDEALVLQRRGKSWEVRCCTAQKGCRNKRLLKGWKGFARENNLKLGDVCLFELVKSSKYTMNVHLIRAR